MPVRLLAVGLVLLCINPGITQGHDAMNVLLNAALCLSPLVLLFRRARVFIPKIDIPLLVMMASVILMPVFFHQETVRWSTMLFSCAYGVFFMMIARLTRMSLFQSRSKGDTSFPRYLNFPKNNTKNNPLCILIEWIVYAFAIVLLIQQFCVLIGIPVLLKSEVYDNPWKLNSLTSEPSHTTLVLSILMFFFSLVQTTVRSGYSLWNCFKEFPALWISYLYVISTTDNATALVMCPISLLPFIRRNNWIGVILIAGIILGIFMSIPAGGHAGRIQRILSGLTTFNDSTIVSADESIAARIVPTLRGASTLFPPDVETITGHGVDADHTDMDPVPGMRNGLGHAGIFSMLHNYGLLGAISLWTLICLVTIVPERRVTIVTFLMAFYLSGYFNMQFVWMVMAFGMVYKYSICGRHELLVTKKSVLR